MYSSSRIQQVQAHNQLMTKLYQQEINNSIASSTIYSVDSQQPANFFSSTQTLQELWINSTTQAVSRLSSTYPQAKIACLNFADYEQTAGGYLQAALAQEEAICFDSTLYQVLLAFPEYYAWNREHLANYLYQDRAIYSPGIIFHQKQYLASADIITCAAPFYRKSALLQLPYSQALQALKLRMTFVKQIAEDQHVDYLVLGTWGAGVFGFNSLDVAKLWKKTFAEKSSIKKVIYAVIPSHNNQAVDNFQKIFI